MKRLLTFKDAASVEMAWFKAYTQAKKDGFNYVVSAYCKISGLQKHYFKELKAAKEFSDMAATNKDSWKWSTSPKTIDSHLKQCWS